MQAIQSDQLQITEVNQGVYEVQNLTRGTAYQVTLNKSGLASCNCPSRKLCKHIVAIRKYREEMNSQPQPPQNVTPLQPKSDAMQEILLILKAIASNNPPSWQRPLKSYPKFDWSKIGASVVATDQYGATKVSWCGHLYTRRAGENKKYGASIWFSRAAGKTEDDETQYLRLITFKNGAEAEPLPDYVIRALR